MTVKTGASVSQIRKALLEAAASVVPDEFSTHCGSRKVDYPEGEPAHWEFGLAVVMPLDYDEAAEAFDALISGPHSVREAIEDDRSLGGLVMDTRVSRINGPTRTQNESTLAEWVIQLLEA
jgi:hypothetical protein